jgi:hypothetical protein
MPAGVLDPHLGQVPGFGFGLREDGDAGCGQPGVLGADTAQHLAGRMKASA